jgi:phosphoesterase RecJ-like protein
MNNSFEEVFTLLQEHNHIAIAGHQNPDGDAIGACLALALALKKMGKKVTVLLEPYKEMYDVIPGKSFILPQDRYGDIDAEVFVALDCGDVMRLGEAISVFDKTGIKVNIDHHISNEFYGGFNIVDGDASSTCELLYRLLRDAVDLDRDIATALYAGILYDTGGFRHTSTSPATLNAAAELMTYDIPFNRIHNDFFERKSYQELKIIGRAFQNASPLYNGKFLYSTITLSEMQEFGCTFQDVGAIISQLKSVKGTDLVCFLYEKEPNVVKVSLRCEDGYDVCKLAAMYGGGGHQKAAGCTIFDTMEKALSMMLKEVEQIMK